MIVFPLIGNRPGTLPWKNSKEREKVTENRI